jgi:hypothetical protein
MNPSHRQALLNTYFVENGMKYVWMNQFVLRRVCWQAVVDVLNYEEDGKWQEPGFTADAALIPGKGINRYPSIVRKAESGR